MIGIICPSTFEYEFISHADVDPDKVKIICSGMGKVRAAYGCHRLMQEVPDLEWIGVIGYAGGLTTSLKVGDLIEPSVFIEEDYNAEPFEKFPNIVRKSVGQKVFLYSVDGAILTQDRFLTSNPYKDGDYARTYKHLACDMESYAVAHFCEAEKIPYTIAKFVSDSADESAEHDFLAACRALAPKLNQSVQELVQYIETARNLS